MNEWVWSIGGLILKGETGVPGENHFTAWVVDEWMSMELWWNDTDRGNWSSRRKSLYSVGGRWMNEYGALVEWYWQGKLEYLEKIISHCCFVHGVYSFFRGWQFLSLSRNAPHLRKQWRYLSSLKKPATFSYSEAGKPSPAPPSPPNTIHWTSIFMLSSHFHLCFQTVSYIQFFPPNALPHACHIPYPSHLITWLMVSD